MGIITSTNVLWAQRRAMMFAIPKIGGLPVLMNNAYYSSANGTKNQIVRDSRFFIAGVFDTGSEEEKTITFSRCDTGGVNISFRLFNDLSGTSVDYWSVKGTGTRTVTSAGRYILMSLPKSAAANMVMYIEIDGQKTYLYKGSNVENVIDVTWNQQAKAMTAEGWAAYNDEKVSTTFADGVCTMTWLVDGMGYSTGLRATNYPYTDVGHVMYVRYDVLPDRDGEWGAESGGGGMPVAANCTANQWNAVRLQSASTKKAWARPIIGNWRGSATGTLGMEVQVRNPAWVNLSVMYGVGNEPTMEEFERQCVSNGIDLSTYQPEDAGTARPWIILKAN